MSKRKWDKEIRAWLEGAELESYRTDIEKWIDQVSRSPMSDPHLQWRVKMSDADVAFNEWANSNLFVHLDYRDTFKVGWAARTRDLQQTSRKQGCGPE